jgi:signal transduction histidine kinase
MLRNPEFKRFLFLLLLLTALSSVAGFIVSASTGILALMISLLFISLFIIYTWRRYTHIAKLSSYLKRINSGDYALDVRDNVEGELSILKSEIYKVTVMLREKSDILLRDKAALQNALSDISHQLKTPLTSMFMMTDLLCDTQLTEEKRREFTDRLRAQLERIQWLVSSLLKLSKLDAKTVAFKPALVSSKTLLEKACAPLLIPIEIKNQTLNLEDGGVTIRCDENWTAEALVNILKNCIEHTPEGGRLSITCTSNPLYTQILIKDSGPGIDLKDLPHVFSRFYRGKNASNDSVGIGLAMAAAIVTGQNGTIDAANHPQGGSVFTVRFPK